MMIKSEGWRKWLVSPQNLRRSKQRKGILKRIEKKPWKIQQKAPKSGKHVVNWKQPILWKIYRKTAENKSKWLVFGCFLVEVTGLEPAISSSRTMRDTTFATPRICKLKVENGKLKTVFAACNGKAVFGQRLRWEVGKVYNISIISQVICFVN